MLETKPKVLKKKKKTKKQNKKPTPPPQKKDAEVSQMDPCHQHMYNVNNLVLL